MKLGSIPWPLLSFGLLTLALSVPVTMLAPSRGVNLALGAEVTASSQDQGVAWSQVVDGDITDLGLHTRSENSPWVQLKLPREHEISRILVYNRLDCCRERAVPLAIEISSDGEQFTRVGKQVNVFDLWELKLNPVRAQYVRVKLLRREFLHLREIEIY